MVDINPNRSNRIMKAERAHRQHVGLTHNPSSIEPGQTLQVRFPNLGENEVIAPGSFFISFALNLKGKKDEARSVVPNVGYQDRVGSNHFSRLGEFDEECLSEIGVAVYARI